MKNKYELVQEKQYIKYKQLTSSVPHKKGANRILKKKTPRTGSCQFMVALKKEK